MNINAIYAIFRLGDDMARKARKSQLTSIYSINQTSDQILFRDDTDRQTMMEIIKEAQRKYDFHCYAFCLLSDYGFKIILDVKDKDISRILSSISISYALYRKSEAKLFTRRFKSKPLFAKEEVIAEVNRINQTSDSTYNSYCFYNENAKETLDWLVDIQQQDIEIKQIKKSSDIDAAQLMLEDWMKHNGCCSDDLKKDKMLRNRCIARLHKETNCSMKQLGILFGGISESSISKILKEIEQ